MRSLAHIEKIEWIEPIANKDKIVLAGVLGWQVIIQVSDYKVGDLCVYIEVDSVLPERPEFEFLRSKNFRIKTMKMAGVLSQGICFPISILKEGNYQVGDDVTEQLGITQYTGTMDTESTSTQKPVTKHKYPKFLMKMEWFRQLVYKQDHRKGKGKGFPTFISKTDENRVQSVPYVLSIKQPWIATEKIDGCSCSLALKKHKTWYGKIKYEFIVCSRNLRLFADDDSHYWKIAKSKNIEKILLSLIEDNDWVAIQGEICGPGIQKNKYQLKDFEFYAFNLIYPHGRASSLVANSILSNAGLKFVPIIDTDYILPDTVQEVLDYAHAKSALNKNIWREGCVFRSQDGKQSFKAVDPLFLLKYDE